MYNGEKEEIHALKTQENRLEWDLEDAHYSSSDSQTFYRYDVSELQLLFEQEARDFHLLKVFCRDNHENFNQSLLRNGYMGISLIDSPGLNINSLTTASLFSKQQEIDVIVFVTSAENHITLSVRLFLFYVI
jgi:mitofusin